MKHKEKKKHLEKTCLQQPGKKSKCKRGKLIIKHVAEKEQQTTVKAAELEHSPDHASETHEVASSSSLDAGETLSASEHLPCVLHSSMHISVDHDSKADTKVTSAWTTGPGSSNMPPNQDLMETENSSSMPHCDLPSSSANNLLVSAVATEKEKIMNVYYKTVPVKRGVDALEDKEDLEPPAKMIKIGNAVCQERNPPKVSFASMNLTGILSLGEGNLDGEQQGKKEEAEKPPENLAQEVGPSATTSAELEQMYSGFRCMSCLQVFPNLQMLKKHLEEGVDEGGSRLNLVFPKMMNKRNNNKITRRKKTNITAADGNDMEILLRFLEFLIFCCFLLSSYSK
ncbi:protein FAM170A-like [Cavia porcellus]|uniref:protein FAM170A-like n=1 Tax=Cavia porcellus TaxID=10141 RepID=UPI002FDF4720